MIRKIIAGGQTGVCRAALDAALELDIPHGGWTVPAHHRGHDALPDRYRLQEVANGSYADQVLKNILDSDGTLIISYGSLTDETGQNITIASLHNRPWMHADLNKLIAFEASQEIKTWIDDNGISVLNVAGPSAGEDPDIYTISGDIITTVYYLDLIQTGVNGRGESGLHGDDLAVSKPLPRTADEAVDRLILSMPLKDRTLIANMGKGELPVLNKSLGEYIRRAFGVDSGNSELVLSCRFASGNQNLDEAGASFYIIDRLHDMLQDTHKLRVVK